MKRNNIENFVNYYSSKYITLRSVKSMIIVFIFIDLASNVTGVELGGSVMLACIILDALTLGYIVFTIVLSNAIHKRSRPITISDCFLLSGIVSAFFVAHFCILSIFAIEQLGFVFFYGILSFAIPILFFVLYFIITIVRIHKDAYNETKLSRNILKRGHVTIFASLGATLGLMISRMFLAGLGDFSNTIILYFSTLIIASLCTMGLINFMKYYYIKKYSIEDRVQITLKELKKMRDR